MSDAEITFGAKFNQLGFKVLRCTDPRISLWLLCAPGIVLAWSPAIHWWRVHLVRVLRWEFLPA